MEEGTPMKERSHKALKERSHKALRKEINRFDKAKKSEHSFLKWINEVVILARSAKLSLKEITTILLRVINKKYDSKKTSNHIKNYWITA